MINGKLGDVAFKQGDQVTRRARSRARCEPWLVGSPAACHDLRRRRDEAFVQALHTLLPRLFVASRPGAERDFVAIRLYSNLAHVYWFSAGKFACAWAHLREMNLAERYPPSPELAQAYSEHAPVMTTLPWYSRDSPMQNAPWPSAVSRGDVWGQGQSLSFVATVLYASSASVNASTPAASRSGSLNGPVVGGSRTRRSGTWRSPTIAWRARRRLRAFARPVLQGDAIGDATAAGIALSGWSRAGHGTVPEAFVAMEIGRDLGDADTATEVHLADGVRLLYAGEVDAPWSASPRRSAIISSPGCTPSTSRRSAPGWPRRCGSRPSSSTRRSGDRAPANCAGPHAARRAHRLARSYRNNLPHALRERAMVAGNAGANAGLTVVRRQSASQRVPRGRLRSCPDPRQAMARLAGPGPHTPGRSELADVEIERISLEPREPHEQPATYSLADRFETIARRRAPHRRRRVTCGRVPGGAPGGVAHVAGRPLQRGGRG